jgi:hypothetical protein
MGENLPNLAMDFSFFSKLKIKKIAKFHHG